MAGVTINSRGERHLVLSRADLKPAWERDPSELLTMSCFTTPLSKMFSYHKVSFQDSNGTFRVLKDRGYTDSYAIQW